MKGAQYVTDARGKKVAVQIPVKRYKQLLETTEEFEAIKAFDKATKRKMHFEPFDQTLASLKQRRSK
jgi:PHD/YefM family antitoxin component YafN of YafNO toxin-antitoxin module